MKRRATRRRNGRFHVSTFTNPGGSMAWRVSGYMPSGARIRENFPTEGEAGARLEELLVETANAELNHALRSTRLTEAQLRDAELAFSVLGPTRTLEKAARFFVERWVDPTTSKSLKDAQQEYLASRESAGCRFLTIRNLRIRTQHLVDRLPGRLVADITPDDITETVDTPGRSPRSRLNELRALNSFLRWCTRKNYTMSNPIAKLDAPRVEQSTPKIMTLDDCRRLLQAAAKFKDGRWLPHTAIALFAGLRPGELAQLTWQKIDLDERAITIDASTSKVRARRIVEMPENLVSWLRAFAIAKPRIMAPNGQNDLRALRALAGFNKATPWTPDITRHTALTMRLALTGDENRTAAWAGTSPGMLHRHYKGLVTRKAGEAYFNLRPDTQKPVKLPKAKAA